ncbi:hypothetical protein Y032_0144g2457 [Ancylostoma ceylanicum]|nr:hypothetical protein Y032_0144g2457 [Ancylostoma ceylanicum]
MKQRETRRNTGNKGAVPHASTARKSFPLRVYARIVTNSCGWLTNTRIRLPTLFPCLTRCPVVSIHQEHPGMIITTGLLLTLLSGVASLDFLESQADSFEDSMDASTTERPLFEPLPPLPDMTSAQRVPGPPGFSPPPEFKEKTLFDGRVGFVVSNGRTRIMGVSRRKPSAEEEDEDEEEERR